MPTSDDPLEDLPPLLQEPVRLVRHSIEQFELRFRRSLESSRSDENAKWALDAAIGSRGMCESLLLSNGTIRLEAAQLLVRAMSRLWRRADSSARKWAFLTFTTDGGNALEYEPVVYLAALRRRADKLIRSADLNAIMVLEVQCLSNFPAQGHGRTHMWHVHAIAWSDDPELKWQSIERSLNKSGRLRHWLSAPTVTVRPIETLGELTRRCGYMLKAPAVARFLRPSDKTKSGWAFGKSYVRSDEASRLMEALTLVSFPDVIFGVSGGKAIRRFLVSALRKWHRMNLRGSRSVLPASYDMPALWKDLRSKRHSRHLPFIFLSRGAEPCPSKWGVAALQAMRALNHKRHLRRQAGRATRRESIPSQDSEICKLRNGPSAHAAPAQP